jgi:hypothetical protein
MHLTQWPASDVRIWSKSLLFALDELGSSQVSFFKSALNSGSDYICYQSLSRSIEEVVNGFLKNHLSGASGQ